MATMILVVVVLIIRTKRKKRLSPTIGNQYQIVMDHYNHQLLIKVTAVMSAVADDVGLVVVDSTAVVVSSCIFGRNQNRID